MARRTKEDAEKTRESLLDAAEKVFLRKGVANASLEEIAREAGLTRGAVYWHFENKCALFKAMHERVKLPMDRLFEEAVGGAEPLKALREFCIHILQQTGKDERTRNVFTIVKLRSEQFDPVVAGQRAITHRTEVLAKFQRLFERAKREGKLAEGISPAIAAQALHSFFSGVFWDYLRFPDSYDIVKLAPKLVDMFFRGIEA